MFELICIMYGNLILGALGVYLSARKKEATERRTLWKKFAVYVSIIHLMALSCMLYRPFYNVLILAICLIGTYEIYSTGQKHPAFKYGSLLIFATIALAFIRFNLKANTQNILLIYSLVVIFDGFSQIAGHIFGKNKISKVSPNKTYEGFLGGLLASLLTYFLISNTTASISLLSIMLIITMGFVGDLLASYYKRVVGVKDYSNLIPAHGGILDRFDSFILAGAAAALLLTFNVTT